MSSFHVDEAATWRDLADALTPDQFAYLETWEAHPEIPPMTDGHPAPYGQHQAVLLFAAREMVESDAAAALYADVTSPPGATFVDQWQQWGDSYSRVFEGTKRAVDDWIVEIGGVQYCDGRVEWSVRAVGTGGDSRDGYMSPALAPRIARALLDAVEELDGAK